MKKHISASIAWGLLPLLLLLSLGPGFESAFAQNEAGVYFPETGHWVTGEFLAVYEEVPDPLKVYGLPITDAFTDPDSDQTVQYFQKAQFILQPQPSGSQRVHRALLGELLYTPGTELPHSPSFPTCLRFDETGFEVCYAFLDFFETNGGVAQFGYPISNFESQGGLIVQYFQRARFEWHPELPAGQRVTLGDLGMEYFRSNAENPQLLLPIVQDNLPQSIVDLQVRAFPELAVMPFQGTQTLFVIVQDQNLRPVPNVAVDYSIRLPSGEWKTETMPSTNARGISQASFEIEASSTGLAEIRVTARFDSFQKETLTSFRIWW